MGTSVPKRSIYSKFPRLTMAFSKREQFIIDYFTEREHLLFRRNELMKEFKIPTEETDRLNGLFNSYVIEGLTLFDVEDYRKMDDVSHEYKLRKDPDEALRQEMLNRKFFPEGWEDDIDWNELKRKTS